MCIDGWNCGGAQLVSYTCRRGSKEKEVGNHCYGNVQPLFETNILTIKLNDFFVTKQPLPPIFRRVTQMTQT